MFRSRHTRCDKSIPGFQEIRVLSYAVQDSMIDLTPLKKKIFDNQRAALTAYAFRKSICEFQDTRMQENTRIQECNKRICDFRWHQKIQECKVENIASASDNNATMTKSKNKTNIKGDMTNMKK